MQRTVEPLALIAASAIACVTPYWVPSWQVSALDPCRLGAIGGALTVAFLWVTFGVGPRALETERRVLTVFLIAMPIVYVAQYALTMGRVATGRAWVEFGGIPLFGTLAFLGLKRSTWFLVVGIAGHGLAWDAWHYRNSTYIPDWYSTGCLLLDVTIAVYVAATIRPGSTSR
jgi:hypothetical protein